LLLIGTHTVLKPAGRWLPRQAPHKQTPRVEQDTGEARQLAILIMLYSQNYLANILLTRELAE